MDEQSLTKKPASAFLKGEYAQALAYYKQAAEIYGEANFRINITLCERRMGRAISRDQNDSSRPTLEQQLAKTQQLLEHYFNRTQELEYQLMDK